MSDKGVLFDLDGVLIDSESIYTVFWAGIDREFPTGIPDFAHAIKGTTLSSILELFPEGDVREKVMARIHDFEDSIVYREFPGVRKFLASLKNAGIPMAIVTSSDKVKMECLFRQLPWMEGYFDAIVDGDMVSRSKPDPQGYLMGARAVGRDIRDCYVFEDSHQGLEAGRRSGATVIGLATTNSRESLEGEAHELIDGFTGFTLDDMLAVSRP